MTRLTSTELATALATRSVEVYYQPLATWTGAGRWEVSGVEALLRCQRASGERIAADRVLSLAERAGLLSQITHYVLSDAFTRLGQWDEGGLPMRVAVNLHAESLMDSALVDKVTGLAAAYAVDPRRLTLEISERTPVLDLRRAAITLEQLRAAGVRVALDDFGTGFALYTRIDTLPCDSIKIDKSLVLGMTRSQEAANAVRALIELGHARNVTVCAEGVEDAAQLATLGNLDCDSVQGFLVGRAVHAAELASAIDLWNSHPASRTPRRFQQQGLPGIPTVGVTPDEPQDGLALAG